MDGRFGAVIVAAGASSRMGGKRSKTLEELGSRPAICRPLEVLASCGPVEEIVVVCREEDMEQMARAVYPDYFTP